MANVSSFSGAMPVVPGGTVELARVDGGYVTTNTTSESTGMNMGCSASIVCDGGPILVEAWSNYVNAGSGGTLFANVYVDGATTSNTNRVWRKATTDLGSIYGQLVITPSAGTRTIAVRPWHSTAAGYVDWATMRVSKIVNQNDGLKPFWTPPVVTQLPSQATVGDQVIYAADATNGVYWHLTYDGLGTYPWKFIGGAALVNVVAGGSATASASYVALSGPTLSIALPGDYDISASFSAGYNGSASAAMGVQIGSGSDEDYAWGITEAPGYNTTHVGTYRKTVATAATLTSKVKSPQGVSITFSERVLRATPVRVKAA